MLRYNFSDLELSFWFELRYFKAGFCKMYLKLEVLLLSLINCIGIVQVSMETERVILARFVDF